MIIGNIQCRDKQVMVPLLKTLIQPIFECGNIIWNTCKFNHLNSLENIQKRFTKRISGLYGHNYEGRLTEIKLPSREYRQMRCDMNETYKITMASMTLIPHPLCSNAIPTAILEDTLITN